MDNLNNLCDNFTELAVCAMSYNNLYNLKLIVICVMALFSIYFLIYTKNMNVQTTYDYYKRGVLKYLSTVYLSFSLFTVLLLRHSVDFETFIMLIIGSYLVIVILGLVGGLMFGWQSSVEMINGQEATSLTEKWKYRKSKNG